MSTNVQQHELLRLTALATLGSVSLIEDSNGYRYTDTYVDGRLVLRTQRGSLQQVRSLATLVREGSNQ